MFFWVVLLGIYDAAEFLHCKEEALAKQLQGEAPRRAPSVKKAATAFKGFWKEKA